MPPPETSGELALQVLRQQASHFVPDAAQAGAGENPRHVHQARVATRRMRAALRLFSDVLPPAVTGLDDDLRWIAVRLGAVRDLDVQVQRLRASAVDLELSADLVPYGAWLEDQRQRALAALAEALQSARLQELVQHLAELAAARPDPAIDRPLQQDGPARLRGVYRTFEKRAERITRHSPAADLHKVRIRAKRVRYAAEFFEPVYGKRVRPLIKHTTRLQDLLGTLQDGVVSRQRIQEAVQTTARTWPAQTSLALGQIIQYEAGRAEQVRKQFRAAYDDVRDRGWKSLSSRFDMS